MAGGIQPRARAGRGRAAGAPRDRSWRGVAARAWPWLLLAAGVALGLYLAFFRQNEAARVRARVAELADAVAVRGSDESFVLRAARIRQVFGDVLDKRARLLISDLGSVKPERGELAELAARAPATYADLRFDVGALVVDLDTAETSAHVHGTVIFVGLSHQGTEERETRVVSIRLDRVDGVWRIVTLAAGAPGEQRLAE